MKIMLLTAATGGGHLRASHAVEQYISEHTQHEVRSVDALKAVGRVLDRTVCGSYEFMAKKTPALFGRLYQQTNRTNPFSRLVPKISGSFRGLLLPKIREYNPDLIITFHPFATEMVSDLKKYGDISAPLICLLTDYGLHRAWIAPQVDAYVVACEDMIPALCDHAVPKEKIFPFGIPVHQVFFGGQDRNMLLQEMNLDPALPTLLFMAGSFGVANIMKFYRDLTETNAAIQIIVITGRNQKLYEAFEQELQENEKIPTKLVFFTQEVEKYMCAADLLVTKPGGLTVSEALACNLPLAVFDAIPGQEEDNAKFLEAHNMGIRLSKDGNSAQRITDLLLSPEILMEMRKSCQTFDASQSIPNLLTLGETLLSENSKHEDAV